EFAEELAFRVGARADQIDAADLGGLAFGDGDVDADAVALERRDRGLHLGRVHAVREILALHLELGLLEHAAIEDAPSAMPISRSTLRTVSGSNSFMPEKSICAIAGRSSTKTTRTSLSTSSRTS